MRIIDISLPLHSETVVWPGESPFQRTVRTEGGIEVSNLMLGSHTGTHIDAPRHFIAGGKGIDEIDLDACIGPCQVIAYPGEGHLTLKECVQQMITQERVLFQLGNSPLLHRQEFVESYRALTREVAEFLVEGEIRLVGVDYLSVEEKGAPRHPVHTMLLEHGVVVVEGLDLSRVEPGEYQLVVLPLFIRKGDAAPARAVLIQGE